MIDRNLRNHFRLCKPQVHRNPDPSIVILLQSTPKSHAAANRAEVKLQGPTPHIGLRSPRYLDALVFVVERTSLVPHQELAIHSGP